MTFEEALEEARRPKTPDMKRFIKLGWEILEAKFRYYELDDAVLSDSEYDRMEKEYEALGLKLGIDTDARYMVGFDMTRPSCRLAADKVLKRFPPKEPK